MGRGEGLGLRQLAEGEHRAHAPVEVQGARDAARADGLVDLHRHPALLVPGAQAVEGEVHRGIRRALRLRQPFRQQVRGGLGEAGQIQVEPALDQGAQDPEGGAPQAVGVLLARRAQPAGEDADEGVEAVGEGHGAADGRGGDGVPRPARAVVLLDGDGDRLGLAVVEGVVAPHDALQLRELAHHLGDQVALGEPRRPPRERHVGADRLGDVGREPLQAQRLVVERAEPLLVDHAAELLEAALQGALAVLLPEEGRVREPRADDALVAPAHLVGVTALDVGHRHEAREQRARGVHHGEALLVLLHGRDHDLARQLQEALVEAPGERHRPFHQRRHLLEQRLAHHRAPAGGERRLLDLGPHRLAPAVQVGDHVPARGEQRLPVRRPRHREGVRVVEAVAAGLAPGLEAQHRARHHVLAVQHQHPVHGAHEGRLARAPAHALRHRQPVEGLLDEARQELGRRPPRLHPLPEQPLALVGAKPAEALDRHAHRAREALGRLRRAALGIEGGPHRRAAAAHRAVGLGRRHRLDEDGEPPRGGVAARRAPGDAGAVEARGERRGEGLGQPAQGLRRQLLGADLDQQVARLSHGRPPRGAAWGSRGARGSRGRPRPRRAPGRARAGCSAGAP